MSDLSGWKPEWRDEVFATTIIAGVSNSLTLHFFFQSGNCSHDAFLSCCGSLLEDRCRHIFIHSCIHKSCTDIRKCGHTHKKYQSTFCVNKSVEINVVLLFCTLMSRNNVHRRTEISVCHRNSIVCRNCDEEVTPGTTS